MHGRDTTCYDHVESRGEAWGSGYCGLAACDWTSVMAVVPSLAFGTLLRRWRKAAGLTQEELAEQAGLSVRGISDLERGLKHRPHRDTVQLLADALQLTGEDRIAFEAAGRLLGSASHAEPIQPLESERPSTDAEPSTQVQIFLIADVRGYTRFTVEHGDEAAARLAAKFADLAEEITAAREGTVIELRGDEALVVFASARQALRAAMELQARFVEEVESDPSLPLNAGVGLDAGEAIPLKGGYRGAALNMAARLCTLAGPGEVLASDTVTNLARKVEGLEYAERGMVPVKGFADPVRVIQVVPSSPSAKPVILPASADAAGRTSASGIELGERGTGQPLPIGGFLGALPEGEMVARQEELGRILSSVDVVLGGSGRLLVLAGEPGIGKTRLAQEVTLNLRNRSFVVAAGRCYEPRQTVPFYPFLDALATLYEACPPHIRSRVATAWPYLARLLPDELGAAPPPSSEGQEDQERLFRAVTAFLGAISEIIPAALLFDDLHWADGSSLDLLQHLARHTRSSRILLLGTYRDVEVQRHHPLSRALRDLSREHLLERIQLRRLEQGETAALIAATMGEAEVAPALAWLVYQGTNGNPFFVDEVLRALVDRGDLYRQNGRWESREIEEIEVPVSVRETIGERLSRLSETAQKILLEGSVLGQTFSFDELQALGSRTEEEVEDALGEAMRAGVVRDIGHDRCTFNHTLTQQALYAELSSRQRRKLHRTAGEALESLPHRGRERRAEKPEYLQAGAQPRRDRATAGWAGELAWHFLEGDDAERALKYALLAGDQAEAVFAHAEAERHYRKAHELACELVDTPREAEALEKLGTVLKTVSKYDEALGLLEAAARLYREAGNLERERCSVAEIGRVHFLRGATSEGIERIQSLLEHAEAIGPSQGLAALYTTQATLMWATGRYEEQLAMAERAAAVAKALGDDITLVQAELWRAYSLAVMSRYAEAEPALQDVIVLAKGIGDLASLSRALNAMSVIQEERGYLQQAEPYLEHAIAVAEQLGDPLFTAFLVYRSGNLAFRAGDWADVRGRMERALTVSRQTGPSWVSPYLLSGLGSALLAQGERESGHRYVEEAVAIAEQRGDVRALRNAESILATWDLLEGRPHEALRRLERMKAERAAWAGEDAWMIGDLALVAEAHLELGDLVLARQLVTRALAHAASVGDQLLMIDGLQMQARIAARQGRWDEVECTLDQALALSRAVGGNAYVTARVLYAYRLLAERAPQTARARLEEALAIFQKLGARPFIERVEQALKVLA